MRTITLSLIVPTVSLDDVKAVDKHDFEQLEKLTESIEKPKDKKD